MARNIAKLPPLPRNAPLIDGNGYPTEAFNVWVDRLEERVGGILGVLPDLLVQANAIDDKAVTEPKHDDASVIERVLANKAVTEPKQGDKAVIERVLGDKAVSLRAQGDESVEERVLSSTNPPVATPKVQTNAISGRTSSSASGTVSLTNSFQTIASVTITSDGSDLFILTTAALHLVSPDNSSEEAVEVRIRRDSTTIYGATEAASVTGENSGAGAITKDLDLITSPGISDSPAAGTYTYTLQARRSSIGTSSDADNRSIIVFELKR